MKLPSHGTPAPAVVRHATRDESGHVVVALCGEVDLSVVDQLRTAFDTSLVAPLAGLVVDTTDVTFFDSTAIGALVGARNRCEEFGAPMSVLPSPLVARVLRATALDDMLTTRDD